MKNKNPLKYTVKLKRLQQTKLKFLLFIPLSICIYLITISTNWILYQLSLSEFSLDSYFILKIPLSAWITYGNILFTVLLGLLSWFISPYSFSKAQRTKCILRKIIELNNFYYSNFKNKIVSSMKIKFYWSHDNLILEVFPAGAKYTSQMNDLSLIFQTAFNMSVLSVQNDHADHTTYVLAKNKKNVIDSTNSWKINE